MGRAPRSVVLTGFGPFPGVPDNATARLVPELARRSAAAFPAHTFHHDVLETAWSAAPERAAHLIAAHRPVLALHFGVARDAGGFRIERTAQNLCRVAADVTGCLPSNRLLDCSGPEARVARLDTAALAARLCARGYPVLISDDAGGYLCNAVLYRSLAAADALGPAVCSSGFIHIPADLSGPPLTFLDAVEGSLEIIRACLETIDTAAES
jgi:pyroglutamyl-peptidase